MMGQQATEPLCSCGCPVATRGLSVTGGQADERFFGDWGRIMQYWPLMM